MKLLFLIVVALLAAACSGETEEPVVTATAAPGAVVAQWLDAVVAGDTDALATLVEPDGLAVLAGVENNVSSDELVALLNGGFEGDLAAGYWTAFRDDFAAIRGGSLESLTVGDESPIEGISNYLAVAIAMDETVGRVIVRRSDTGWRVDLVATVGPALVRPLGDYLLGALNGDNAVVIADAYRSAIVPGLDAAIALDESNSDLVFGTEYLRQLSNS